MSVGVRRRAMTNRRSRAGGAVEATEAALRELLTDVPSNVRRRILQEVGVLIEEHVQEERERCVAMCQRRGALWKKTSAAKSGVAAAREEARARANEARYLADLIESGADVSGTAGSASRDA
jgi:hypothetical protein